MTHTEASDKFKRCRDKETGYRLAKHTLLQNRGRAFAVRYHETDIVMIRPDDTYRLNSGGFRTRTTKERINCYSPCTIAQINSMWYIGNTPYTDQMLIDSAGNLIGTPKHTFAYVAKMKRRVDRLFTKFLKLVADSARGRDIGDWYSYRTKIFPKINNKTYLTRLWNEVLIEPSMERLFVWVYLSNLGVHQFEHIRRNCMKGLDDHMLLSSLRTFMRHRKQQIAEMILHGELSDGTVSVS